MTVVAGNCHEVGAFLRLAAAEQFDRISFCADCRGDGARFWEGQESPHKSIIDDLVEFLNEHEDDQPCEIDHASKHYLSRLLVLLQSGQ